MPSAAFFDYDSFMDQLALQPLFDWIGANPAWAGLMVFLIAMSESLLVVGLIVPGTVLMFGVGALVGTGVLGFEETLLWAFLGAIAGDGISFWIGYFFSDRVERLWPFKNRPQLLAKAQSFFLKHGGKGILFGRFVGPVRPIIPAVAGMMKMNPWKFSAVNVFSALIWAPAYLIPGIVFGTSIGLASQVTTRLAILIVGLVFVVWFSYWAIRRVVLFVEPRAERWISASYKWARKHRTFGPLLRKVLDKDFSPTVTLLWLAVMLLVLSLTLIVFTIFFSVDPLIASIDRSVFNFFQQSRLDLLDGPMVLLYQAGDFSVLSVAVVVLVMLHGLRKEQRALRYWAVAFGVGVLALVAFDLLLDIPRPMLFNGPSADALSPGWQATMPFIVFGFLAILLARNMNSSLRWSAYSFALIFSLLISFAGLYLGAHWLSDVIIGFMFAISWVLLLSLIVHRREKVSMNKVVVSSSFVVVFVVALSLNAVLNFGSDRLRFSYEPVTHYISETEWRDGGWKKISTPYRVDTWGREKQPLSFQWMVNRAELVDSFKEDGWMLAPSPDFSSFIKFLAPDIGIEQLPVLPNLYKGKEESLIMTKAVGKQEGAQYVLRLWLSDFKSDGQVPVFIGNISVLRKKENGFTVAREVLAHHVSPLDVFPPAFLARGTWRQHSGLQPTALWDGSVLLIRGM